VRLGLTFNKQITLFTSFIFRPKTRRRQGVRLTPCWKTVHRISEYQGYQPDIRRISRENWPNSNYISDRFQQNIKKYLLNIPWYQPDTSTQWSQSKKTWNIVENSHVLTESNSQISTGYQPDIKAFCTPDIMTLACHDLPRFSCSLWSPLWYESI